MALSNPSGSKIVRVPSGSPSAGNTIIINSSSQPSYSNPGITSGSFFGAFAGSLTANRTYTFPDLSGTIALNPTSNTQALSGTSIAITLTLTESFLTLTLSAATTISSISLTTGLSGATAYLSITQDATGSRVLSFGAGINLVGSINSAANSNSIIKLITFNGGTSWDAIVIKPQSSSGLNLWTPSQITTALWLDASDSATVAIGTGVSQWSDKSGNARHATQGTAASQPSYLSNQLNGKNAIRFTTDDFLNFTGSFLTSSYYLIAGVVARNSNKSNNFILGGTGGNGDNLHIGWVNDTTFTHRQWFNDYDTTVAAYSSEQFFIFVCYRFSTGAGVTWINGTQGGSNSNTLTLTGYPGSAIGRMSSNYFEGKVAELIMVTDNARLNTTAKDIIEGYLAYKWINNLPSTHPYKNSPPVT